MQMEKETTRDVEQQNRKWEECGGCGEKEMDSNGLLNVQLYVCGWSCESIHWEIIPSVLLGYESEPLSVWEFRVSRAAVDFQYEFSFITAA